MIEDNSKEVTAKKYLEDRVREIGLPKLVRHEDDADQIENCPSSVATTNSSVIIAETAALSAAKQEDEREAQAQYLVAQLANAILSWGGLDTCLDHCISIEVCTNSFIWNAKDFIKEYQEMEAKTGRYPSIKLCITFQDQLQNIVGASSTQQSQTSGGRTTHGRLFARIMEPSSAPAISGRVDRPGTGESMTGPRCLPLITFPKTNELGVQKVLDGIMHRTHPVLRECFPDCHLVALQPCALLWNANKTSRAGSELEAALERAKYLRDNGQLKSQLNLETEDSYNHSLKKENVKKLTQTRDADGMSCAETVEVSQDFTVNTSISEQADIYYYEDQTMPTQEEIPLLVDAIPLPLLDEEERQSQHPINVFLSCLGNALVLFRLPTLIYRSWRGRTTSRR